MAVGTLEVCQKIKLLCYSFASRSVGCTQVSENQNFVWILLNAPSPCVLLILPLD